MAHQYPIIHFNFNLANYIDKSWFMHIPHGEIISQYNCSKYALRYISEYLLKYFEINNKYEFDIPRKIESFGLLPPRKLVGLIQYAGSILNFSKIQKIILRKDIEQLKLMISEDAYYFGLRRSPVFKDTHSNIIPISEPSMTIGESTIRYGICCLLSALEDQPKSVKQRVLLKLPFNWVDFDGSDNLIINSDHAILFFNKILNMVDLPDELILSEAS